MSQSSEDLEKRLVALQEKQHALRQLTQSPGWKVLKDLCEGAVTTRRQTSFATMSGIRGFEDCFSLSSLGGEIAGMQFVLSLPHTLLKDLERDIQLIVVERREEENG